MAKVDVTFNSRRSGIARRLCLFWQWALRSVASSHTANYPVPDKQQVNQSSPPHPNAPDTYSSNTGQSSPRSKSVNWTKSSNPFACSLDRLQFKCLECWTDPLLWDTIDPRTKCCTAFAAGLPSLTWMHQQSVKWPL
ncbi:hypothetical protein JOB18_022784 [Solea senegalensis]|uniref:Uncharacterized protein n=1 Tax=Solea senegalensis TaxID=28829 RepID=A0AAV6S864_SOLSE|nr:hypothetical protein JOB18_022784 [Solea senegalensis]